MTEFFATLPTDEKQRIQKLNCKLAKLIIEQDSLKQKLAMKEFKLSELLTEVKDKTELNERKDNEII